MDVTANLSFFTHHKLSKPSSLLAEKEPAVGSMALLQILPFQTRNLSTRAWVSRRFSTCSHRNVSGKAFHEDGNTMYKSAERERLVALFKRIQISISERDSGIKSTRNVDGSSLETSVVEFLQQSDKETKVKKAKVKQNEEKPSKRKTRMEIEPNALSELPYNFKPTRLPSNFVKRSPIPSPTRLRAKDTDVSEENKTDLETEKKLSEIKAMKLAELKELAKQRGIRGYSKLNKTALLELLISQVDA